MANREKGGRVVFIGNIPYGVSEEQIMDIFGRCGQVVGFRLVYDKETGQPKGFGFLEFTDTDAAASAVRNLNEFELNGRTLRVDYSNDNRGATNNSQQQDTNRAPAPAHFNNMPPATRSDPGALPPLPPGIDLPPGITAFDAISQTLSKVPTPQLLDFISQLKNLCASNPQQASALLSQTPQLGYAVFQAMLLLNLVDTSIVQQLVATVGPPPPQQLPSQPPPPAFAQPPVNPPQNYPPGYAPQQQYGQPYAPTPPQQPAYAPPPQAQPPPQAAPPDQQQLIQQVMALSREQILGMPEGARQQILALRAQFGAPVI